MPINVKDVRDYLPDMDQISEEIPEKIEASYKEQEGRTITPSDVRAVLQKDRITPDAVSYTHLTLPTSDLV